MSSRSESLRLRDKTHLWHPFTPQKDWAESDPLVIERGEGSYLFDTDGNRYLDGTASLWCNVHGHRHPKLDAALKAQVDRVAHSTLLGLSNPPAIELAGRLAALAPPGLTRVFLSGDGASAVEAALKMSFQYWHQKPDPEPRRTRFVSLGDAYHGDTLGGVSLGGMDRFHAMFSPLLFDALRIPSPYCYRCPLGLTRPECGMACAEELDRVLSEHPGEVVAVVVESRVQGAAGMIVQPEGYLRRLREITRAHDTFLICDEVAVGFGKTGTLFGCEGEGVAPDFLCLGKGLSGGYLPMAATLTTEEVYSAFFASYAEGKVFQHGHTFGGNPLGSAVSLASLAVFEEEKTLDGLGPKIALISRRFDEFRGHPHVGDVRQCGMIGGIELVADRRTKENFPPGLRLGHRLCMKAREHGLLIRPLGDVIVVMPPLAITLDQLETMLDVIGLVLDEIPRAAS